ncbi:trimeric intracellular cation channel type B [Lissotriton helveticus]
MELMSDVSLEFSRISMFPFFELAHYLVSLMTLREQAGAVEVAWRSPIACWFSAMLYCFGGALLSAVMLAEPPVLFLTNDVNIFMASATWFLVFYCPGDIVYQFFSFLPVRVVLAGMKEMTRTRKILAGVAHANSHFKDAWMVMIAVGWARGAGGGLISNFEQLVRGVWKPESNELLKMSYPVKVTLIGSVLFTLQHTQHLSITKHNLVFLYSIFLVFTKVVMMLTGSAVSPFAPFEAVLSLSLFHWQQVPQETTCDINTTSNGTSPTCKDLSENGDFSNHPTTSTNAECLETTRKRITAKAE